MRISATAERYRLRGISPHRVRSSRVPGTGSGTRPKRPGPARSGSPSGEGAQLWAGCCSVGGEPTQRAVPSSQDPGTVPWTRPERTLTTKADDGTRTHDTWLGKPVLYQLSYVR